jgi:hypothetical protein
MSKPIRTCIRIFILLNLIPMSLSTIGVIHNSFNDILNVIGISYLIGLPVPILMFIIIYFKPSRL